MQINDYRVKCSILLRWVTKNCDIACTDAVISNQSVVSAVNESHVQKLAVIYKLTPWTLTTKTQLNDQWCYLLHAGGVW